MQTVREDHQLSDGTGRQTISNEQGRDAPRETQHRGIPDRYSYTCQSIVIAMYY